MKKYERGRFYLLIVICLVLIVTGMVISFERNSIAVFSTSGRFPESTLILDPGHGGEDGGAVSPSGQVESEINLAIALRMDNLMGLYGVNTILTRSEDVSIYDPPAKTLREKKVSDIRNRVAMVEAQKSATLISIHQNIFSNPKYHGTQVFYANEELSLPLAKQTQEAVKTYLDPDNTRAPQKIPSGVYLMNHISCRAILVECGFLSNPAEEKMLQESGYQTKLAIVLTAAYLNCENT